MEELEAFRDELQSQVTVSFENGSRRFLVVFFGARLLDGEKFDDLVMVWINRMSLPEHLVALFNLVDTPEQLALKDENLDVVRVLLAGDFELGKGEIFVGGPDISQCFQVDELDILSLDRRDQVKRIVTVALFDQGQPLHEIQLVHSCLPILLMLQIDRLLEALNGRAKVTQFDVDLSFLDVDFGDGLVVEEHFIELDQGCVEIVTFECFFSMAQLLQDLVLLDLIELKLAANWCLD